ERGSTWRCWGVVLFLGGVCASLFGTGADIVLYTLLVTRFRMNEKIATHMSVMLMAAISILGYAYRAGVDQDLTDYQIRTWLCAYPVVLFMAPFGAFVLQKMNVEAMLRIVVALNIGQLAYFTLKNPTPEKFIASAVFTALLMAAFWTLLARMSERRGRSPAPVKA
ncbi:MAG: TSUP family transporter, partial [Rhodomicrobium sp.]|nr:TSUP family transporter [Rhodomicrobium sp.]